MVQLKVFRKWLKIEDWKQEKRSRTEKWAMHTFIRREKQSSKEKSKQLQTEKDQINAVSWK